MNSIPIEASGKLEKGEEIMPESEEAGKDEAQAGRNASEGGEVETAGETTAAATISGPPDTRPVGADTMVDVAGTPSPEES